MLEDKHIVRLFSRMSHLYGHKWASVYGDAVRGGALTSSAKQWLYDLREYNEDQVDAGVAAVIRKRPDWPPAPLEFMDLCDGVPSVAEILDRRNDYGPICAAIRERIDWFNVDSMASAKASEAVTSGRERALVSIRRDGTYAALVKETALALTLQRKTESISHAA